MVAGYLYDPDPLTAVPCGKAAPGAKSFCRKKKCGKCGREQGHCKKSKQCLPGLKCQKSATLAAKYGVPASRKFCQD